MSKEIKLKPCPFCGGKAKLHQAFDYTYCVQCDKCWVTTLHKHKAEEVVRAWNRRTEQKTDDIQEKPNVTDYKDDDKDCEVYEEI